MPQGQGPGQGLTSLVMGQKCNQLSALICSAHSRSPALSEAGALTSLGLHDEWHILQFQVFNSWINFDAS